MQKIFKIWKADGRTHIDISETINNFSRRLGYNTEFILKSIQILSQRSNWKKIIGDNIILIDLNEVTIVFVIPFETEPKIASEIITIFLLWLEKEIPDSLIDREFANLDIC